MAIHSAIAQKLHAHFTIEDCRHHLQSAAAGILIDASGLGRDAPRTPMQHQYWHPLTLNRASTPSRRKSMTEAVQVIAVAERRRGSAGSPRLKGKSADALSPIGCADGYHSCTWRLNSASSRARHLAVCVCQFQPISHLRDVCYKPFPHPALDPRPAAEPPRAAALWLTFPTRPWLCGRQRRTPPWWDIRGRSCIPRRVRAWLPNPDGRGDG